MENTAWNNKKETVLYIIVPCYNEEQVLPVTSDSFLKELQQLIEKKKISSDSRIMYVNDGSTDKTWQIIKELSEKDSHFIGISQSRNRGHQNALLAGLMEAKDRCDVTITIDCDGQDSIEAMEEMIDAYDRGCEVVYGVRNARKTDSFFKRVTAQCFYRFIRLIGGDVIYNHADYRLISNRVLEEFANFGEVNLFLRGLIPLVGFESGTVYYERHERVAGRSHYSLGKMMGLAFDGITSLSIRPMRIISLIGLLVFFASLFGVIWIFVGALKGNTIAGWASMTIILCLLGGIQLLSIGVIGEYIGKIYLETKHRPRYIISERTYDRMD
ncbi:MAG: glycosyltransferase family 2 protein [Lachnospiraceae bacterium]|nr:glycosyltransferase family 2 protein [Lachnospiraceae bacterium]